jgi:hypothetical protein
VPGFLPSSTMRHFASLFLVFALIHSFISLGIASPLDPTADLDQCKIDFLNLNTTVGAVDLYGHNVTSLQQIDGIRHSECDSLCGNGWQPYSWLQISSYLGTWLLPWIALVGQLPFQTKGQVHDCLSAILMVGSPILGMYSLILTFRNSLWIHGQVRLNDVVNRYGEEKHLKSVAVVLAACQQVPLRIGNRLHLAYSILHCKNEEWWADMARHLRATARAMPESLWPQMALVAVTYAFSLSAGFYVVGGISSMRL